MKGFFPGEDGRYYVNDSGGARIAVFGPDGRFERSIGRRGQGPGEFMICELIDRYTNDSQPLKETERSDYLLSLQHIDR